MKLKSRQTRLFGEGLKAAVAPWLREVGWSDRERLDALTALAVRERTLLEDCLAALFPELPRAKGVAALTSFRNRINDAAAAARPHPLELSFHLDSGKKKLGERECWFEGPDPAVLSAALYSAQVTADPNAAKLERPRAIVTTGTALKEGKKLVRFFMSYARRDQKSADALLSKLKDHFGASKAYEYEIWSDGEIPVGEDWRERIARAIDSCDFGLLLVSPAFLSREFIKRHELPHFAGAGATKPVVPVGLQKVSFERLDLRGLEAKKIFLKGAQEGGGRFYLDRGCDRPRFVADLFEAIEERLDDFFGAARRPEPADYFKAVPVPEPIRYFQPPKAFSVSLGHFEHLDGQKHAQARDALTEIERWALDPNAPAFFAVLGEYGIGKTTTLKQLTRDWLERRAREPYLPLPIYVDLRDYVGERRDSVPDIEELLTTAFQRSWKVRDRAIAAHDVLRLVREEGALIIFDGLDEKVVHLPPGRAREFIRTLWSVLPDAARDPDALPAGKRRGKLLISCRSHYFPDVWRQTTMLVGEGREGLDSERFPAICLLPFSEDQIRSYLASMLESEERVKQTFDLIASIHDLTDLARRPYLLSLIVGRIRELEDLKARGKAVNAALLYDLVVRSWLNRDEGKHQLDPLHKRRLMEDLAADLWRDGSKQWPVSRLEAWLDEYLARNPVIERAYANKDRTVLKEDLRTATFVLRPDTEREHFRFAHTSLQEYFLARYLVRALEEGQLERWDLPMVSRETLDFVGQVLELAPQPAALQALEAILGGELLGSAMLGFRYWLHAIEAGRPAPAPRRVRLAGASLEGWIIRGRSADQPLDLSGADLSGAWLNRARLQDVKLQGADLSGADARQAVLRRVDASQARAQRADFSGQSWCGGSLRGADLDGARLSGCHWVEVDVAGARLPLNPAAPLPADVERDGPTLPPGHSGSVQTCAWSPDGRRILSGSSDGSLKLWDASSGRCLLTLEGHSSSVLTCAWSPDGRRILSGSHDLSLRVWDASSGRCLLTIGGHASLVRTCAWSPDGQRLLSGFSDNALKIWDASSGQCLLTLEGHFASVLTCAWSPDGRYVLSGSHDNSLRVWDAASGDCLVVLEAAARKDEADGDRDATAGDGLSERKKNSSSVLACAWGPDGQRLLAAFQNNSLRIWDAPSGRRLLTQEGHRSLVRTCAWSPDGQRLLSSCFDNTIKVWEASSGRCLLTLEGHTSLVRACAWSPDGRHLLSGFADNSLKVWDAESGRCLLSVEGHSSSVQACAWSPDGRRFLTGSSDNALKIWEADSNRCLLAIQGHSSSILACAWSPDGQHLLSGFSGNTLKVWDTSSGRCLLTLQGHTSLVRACAWSPDGQRFLSGSSDNALKVWNASSGRCLLTLRGHSSLVRACAWSPDSQRLLSGSSDHSLKVWDAATGGCLLTLQGHSSSVLACAWSPDGQRLFSGCENALKVWDASSGSCLLTVEGHASPVQACAWSPDGQRLLSGLSDNTLEVWDAASGRRLLALEGHASSVRACAWSPDGRRILSGSADNSFKIWDASSGQCLWTGHLFPEEQSAMVDEVNRRVVGATEEAWRWLGWQWVDPATGQVYIAPL